MRLSIEAYGGPFADLPYAGRADEPMCEFWMEPFGMAMETCKEMSSAAHTYGKPIVGAEAFTSMDSEKWRQHPATIKALGDQAMCDGVNRFVFHRYAMQPWTNPNRVPGMMMGPWGLHYERSETWWEMSKPWHEYLARCHYMLRRGLFAADICYLQPENAPQNYRGHDRHGYDFDNISPEAVLTRMSVSNGRLALPDGMTYRVLALPDTTEMTPKLLGKIKELVNAGAKVVGKLPDKSPSLTGYPGCDEQVKKLADEIRATGKVEDKAPEQALEEMGVPPDFASDANLRYIHRTDAGTEIYFVANPRPSAINAVGTFRVKGKQPELWQPETGKTEMAAIYQEKGGRTNVTLSLGPSESVFVVFRKPAKGKDSILSLTLEGKPIGGGTPSIKIIKATYGVLDDPQRTRDVRTKAQRIVDGGESTFQVARLAEGDDPAFGIVKTVIIEYTIDGKSYTATATDPELIDLTPGGSDAPVAEVHGDSTGQLLLETRQAGRYEVKTTAGKTLTVAVTEIPAPKEITGPWQVSFDPKWGGPTSVTFAKLDDWSKRSEDGIKYYSGAATYRTTFKYNAPGAKSTVLLDLGGVAVMAEVKLNGKSVGIVWKPPYRVDITDYVKRGDNALEVKVANLLINRMIGDEQLPEDSDRNGDGTLRAWPKWLEEGKPSPSGRFTFADWRLWRKGDPLQESGLLGPVKVYAVRQVKIGDPRVSSD